VLISKEYRRVVTHICSVSKSTVKGILKQRPNFNDVDNTDISNSELKMKVTRTTHFVLLYYIDITHPFAQIFMIVQLIILFYSFLL